MSRDRIVVVAHRATDMPGDEQSDSPPDASIHIRDEMPSFGSGKEWVDNARTLYRSEAKAIADALSNSLPGGTLDQLLAELLRRKASLLIVTAR